MGRRLEGSELATEVYYRDGKVWLFNIFSIPAIILSHPE